MLVAVTLVAGCTSDGSESSVGSEATTTAPAVTSTSAPAAVELGLPTVTEPAADVSGYSVYRPADLDARDGPWPVIVWANGGCVRYEAPWAPLLERWASAGFVVVAITALPGVEPSLEDPSGVEDHAAAIDWAERQNALENGAYEGRLDLERVAAAGNSCGGISALNLASTDQRVRSVFVLSGSSALPGSPPEVAAEVIDEITAPIGFAVGAPQEDIANPNAQQDYDLAEHVPAYLATRSAGDHVTVSTDTGVLSEVAEISTNWMDATLNDNRTALDALLSSPCSSCEPGLWTIQSKNL